MLDQCLEFRLSLSVNESPSKSVPLFPKTVRRILCRTAPANLKWSLAACAPVHGVRLCARGARPQQAGRAHCAASFASLVYVRASVRLCVSVFILVKPAAAQAHTRGDDSGGGVGGGPLAGCVR